MYNITMVPDMLNQSVNKSPLILSLIKSLKIHRPDSRILPTPQLATLFAQPPTQHTFRPRSKVIFHASEKLNWFAPRLPRFLASLSQSAVEEDCKLQLVQLLKAAKGNHLMIAKSVVFHCSERGFALKYFSHVIFHFNFISCSFSLSLASSPTC